MPLQQCLCYEYHNVLLSHHGQLADFEAVEPRELHLGHHPTLELHRHEHHILDLRLKVAAPLGRDPHRHFIQEVEGNGNVVGTEAPQGVLVLPHLTEVEPHPV